LINVKLSAGYRRLFNRLLRLLFAADEQNLSRRAALLPEGNRRTLELFHRLIEIDDVNGVAFLENERLHFRVPPFGLVAKMNAGFKQLGN
jgi:hypothetical protein